MSAHLREAIQEAGGIRAAGRLLGIPESTIRARLRRTIAEEFEVSEVPAAIDVDELISERIRKFTRLRKVTDAAAVRTVRLKTNEPIGIGFMGDLHLDDDGTNIAKVLDHAEIFSGTHPGLYAAFLGDAQNSWAGRLERLYGEQSTSINESLALAEHVLRKIYWLFIVIGNHDLWSRQQALFEWLVRDNTVITKTHEQRIRLLFPNKREVVVRARHGFPGHSQWTKQFGQIKAAVLGGDADIYVGGHKHVSGYSHGWHDGQRRMWHAIQVASYKEIDDYPVELGLSPADLYQCPVAIIDPRAKDPINLVRWEFDVAEGAARLAWERSR